MPRWKLVKVFRGLTDAMPMEQPAHGANGGSKRSSCGAWKPPVTDGEFRKLNFQDSFGACVEGFRSVTPRLAILENQSRRGKALPCRDVHRGIPV